MLEQEIQKQVMDWLKGRKWVFWRVNLGGVRRSGGASAKNPMAGFPDLAGILPDTHGRLFVIEIKTATGRLSPAQVKWRNILTERGVVYVLARSLDDAVVALSSIGPLQ